MSVTACPPCVTAGSFVALFFFPQLLHSCLKHLCDIVSYGIYNENHAILIPLADHLLGQRFLSTPSCLQTGKLTRHLPASHPDTHITAGYHTRAVAVLWSGCRKTLCTVSKSSANNKLKKQSPNSGQNCIDAR